MFQFIQLFIRGVLANPIITPLMTNNIAATKLSANDQESECVYLALTTWYGTGAFPWLTETPYRTAPIMTKEPAK